LQFKANVGGFPRPATRRASPAAKQRFDEAKPT
jgi:hypothetical protein